MKFIHVADVHLGAEPEAGKNQRKNRADEIWHTFEKLVRLCEDEQVDLLLIAGDLFHRQPLRRELKEVNQMFAGLTHTKVVLIAGNHDYMKKNSPYHTFAWASNVRMLRGAEPERAVFPELHTAVYGFSYHTRERQGDVWERIRPDDPCRYHILLGHGGDEKHAPFQTAALERLGFDYVALGHIHKPEVLRENWIAYAGALEPIDKNDTGAHGYVRGEITMHGTKTSFVPFASRQYVPLCIEVEEYMTGYELRQEIRAAIEENGTQHIYRIALEGEKDPDVVFDLSGADAYGNIIEIRDDTRPAYDYYRLMQQNKNNLLGRYIASFGEASPGTVEYDALCEGVHALMESVKRGGTNHS